jgi:hypothetical protein
LFSAVFPVVLDLFSAKILYNGKNQGGLNKQKASRAIFLKAFEEFVLA